jgi:HPr kinase/phosphorylase
MAADASIHASAVLIGAKAVLIRGASGSGKSHLAWQLIQAVQNSPARAKSGILPFARLVGDDRVHIEATSGRLLVRPAPALAGLIEIRGLGIRQLAHETLAVIGLVVDLAATDAARFPAEEAAQTAISGVRLPRLAVAPEQDALALVLAWLGIAAAPGPATD